MELLLDRAERGDFVTLFERNFRTVDTANASLTAKMCQFEDCIIGDKAMEDNIEVIRYFTN